MTPAKRGRWSLEEDALLREIYPCTRTDELPQRLHRSRSAIKNRVAALHLRKNDDVSMRRRWKRVDDQLLRQLYPELLTAEVAKRLGRTVESINGRATTLGLRKTEAHRKRAWRECGLALNKTGGAAHRFPKGHVPANKGLRRPGWGPGRMKETQFRKGERRGVAVKLWKPIGTERISRDGYLERKINNDLPLQRRWRAVHLIVWEAANGPLPRGHAVAFKNGDKTAIRLGNLELISRGELMLRNSVHNLPAPLPQAIQLLGALKGKINRRARKNEEQNRRPA